jgi:NADH-quinone oxidoreductase subunit J
VTADAFLFWFLAITTIAGGITVVSVANPIYAALSLAFTMVSVAAVFVTLEAYFVAGVQLIVYAGAVMVLFVMVLMLFDLKHELEAFARGKVSGAIKLLTAGLLGGLLIGAIAYSPEGSKIAVGANQVAVAGDPTKNLGYRLFTQHIFAFEALGVLLLVIAVGAVALSRSKGGTHGQR